MTTATVTLSVTGMHCGSCGLLIDDTLEDLPGITSSATSVRSERTTVTYDPDTVTVNDIVAAITESGYTATIAG